MSVEKIAIGSDHAGFDLKAVVIEHLKSKGIEVKDYGTFSNDSCDYPDYAHQVAENVENSNYDLGVLICGSANGVCMSANKHKGIRAGLSWTPEIASLARQHNDANIVCIPARYLNEEVALEITDVFISTDFEGGRHQRRVDKI